MQITFQRLAALRQAAGLSQQKLADLIEVDRSSLSRMENGERGIDIEVAQRWVLACQARVVLITADHELLVKAVAALDAADAALMARLAVVLPTMHPVRRTDLLIQLEGWERSFHSHESLGRTKSSG